MPWHHPPCPPQVVEDDVTLVEEAAAMQLRSFGKGFTIFEDRVASEVLAEEKMLERDLAEFEQLLEKVGGFWQGLGR